MITVYTNKDFGSVRSVELNNEIYFVGKDVADALGYSNANKAIQVHVDDEDKINLDFKGYSHFGKSLWAENDYSNKVIINESGVYSLIFNSKLSEAKRFKHWVTYELLPSIRKNGGYVVAGREQEFVQSNHELQAQVKELQIAISALQAQVAPHICDYSQNVWKKKISTPLTVKVVERYNMAVHDTYNFIYSCMKKNFGFDAASAIIRYCYKYNLPSGTAISPITVIADEPIYQEWFTRTVNKLLNQAPTIAEPTKSFTTHDNFDDIMQAVTEKLGYKTPCIKVYEKIYGRITTKQGWKALLTRHRCTNKKELIMNNKKYWGLFVKTCNDIINN